LYVDIFNTDKKYQIIYADPPWKEEMTGEYQRRHKRRTELPYKDMSIDDICRLPINKISGDGCHLWLWTTNQYLKEGFIVLEAWGFKYLAPITWVKTTGLGNWFIHRTQTLLFGYKDHCIFPAARYKPTVIFASNPTTHSQKPQAVADLIEEISPAPRIELFCRKQRLGWDCWGDQCQ
jgi:site-specific DNA-methyltransferase (adenine-specific)